MGMVKLDMAALKRAYDGEPKGRKSA
jgi:hypothetical protein